MSSYCPEELQFMIYNDLVGSLRAYGKITDDRVATAERKKILEVLTPELIEDVRRLAHDEDVTETEFKDTFEALKECKKNVYNEIKRLKDLYQKDLIALGIQPKANISILSLNSPLGDWKFNIVGRAAAAEDGVGVLWEENEVCRLTRNQVAILKLDTIAPIGLTGQYLLLDSDEREPDDSDLIVVETQDKKRYVRRFWVEGDKSIWLEATNPIHPYRPIKLSEGEHLVRRVVGVLFDEVGVKSGQEGDEWIPGKLSDKWLDGVVGVRVEGTSMEPIAREGQIVLVRKKVGQKITKADLACIDMTERETVIKRCYPSKSDWVLCSINPNEVQDPISVSAGEIRHAYPLVGVLFEVYSATTVAIYSQQSGSSQRISKGLILQTSYGRMAVYQMSCNISPTTLLTAFATFKKSSSETRTRFGLSGASVSPIFRDLTSAEP